MASRKLSMSSKGSNRRIIFIIAFLALRGCRLHTSCQSYQSIPATPIDGHYKEWLWPQSMCHRKGRPALKIPNRTAGVMHAWMVSATTAAQHKAEAAVFPHGQAQVIGRAIALCG